ncbi:FMO-like and/or Pyr redox 2 domain containing protein, partial [Asbolus verrucosus]
CNGNYNEPIRPKLTGEEKFNGKISHSQQYRSPESFTGQKVLVIGGGPSAVDLVQQISFVAQHVVISYHTKTTSTMEFRSNVSRKPDVLRIKDGEEIEFVDNSCDSFDSIIYCTGYKCSFPFLDGSCGVTVDDDNIVRPLYKQVINIEKPTMCFIGIPIYGCAFQLFDLQARFFCKYLTGAKSLPSPEEMRADTEKMMKSHWAKGYTKRQTHFLGPEQQSYYDDLATTADIKSVAPLFSKLYIEALNRFYNDFQNFREDRYKIIDDESYVREQ